MSHFYVICFDISDERRLRRVSNEMENFGVRVQKSLFECHLEDADLAEIKKRMEKHIDAETDRVRYYPLCPKDVADIRIVGPGHVTQDVDYHLF